MRYLVWLLRAVMFLVLLGFAVKNDQPVVLRYFFGYEWQASLVVILLLFLRWAWALVCLPYWTMFSGNAGKLLRSSANCV